MGLLSSERLRVDKPWYFHCPSDYSSMGYSVPVACRLLLHRSLSCISGWRWCPNADAELRAAVSANTRLLVIVFVMVSLG